MIKLRFKSITSHINLAMITIVVIAILIISSIVIYHLLDQTKVDYQRSINQQLEVVDQDVLLYVKSIIENTKMLAHLPVIKDVDSRITSYKNMTSDDGVIPMTPTFNSDYEKEVFQILEVLQTTHSNIRNASVGVEENGGFVKYPPSPRFDGYDARERSWYKAALDNLNDVTIPGIYKTSNNENVILSVIPIQNDHHEIVGVVSIDFELNDLSNLLDHITIGIDGYVILTDGSGNILAHPKDTSFIGRSIKETGFEDFIKDDQVLIQRKIISSSDDGDYVVESIKSDLDSFDLYFFVVLEESEYTISAKIMMKEIIISVMFLLVFVFIYSNWMSKRLSKPIVTLTKFSDLLANGSLNERLDLNRVDEIGHLTSSFNTMAEAIENSKTALESKVEERTIELSKTNRHLIDTNEKLSDTLELLKETQSQLVKSEKLAGLGTMVSGVAHEMNTPLGTALTMVTFTETLLMDFKDKMDLQVLKKSDLEDYLIKATKSVDVLSRSLKNTIKLVDHFKEVSVSQSAKSKTKINLLEQIQAAVSLKSKTIGSEKCHVEIECNDDIVMDFYPRAFRQILHLFIENTLKHAFEEEEDKQIQILVKQKDDHLEMIYQDNGKGINQAETAHIFEPFYTNYRHEGSIGLGLHIVYNIVTYQMNGEIEVNSSENRGMKFTIKWPV